MSEFGYTGIATSSSDKSEFNAIQFAIEQALSRVNTATLVKVVAVTNSGGLSPVGFVDVQPLVNQVDGAKNATPHGVVNSLPYTRIQGGSNAIIIDPQVGDIGIAVFASHDITTAATTKAQANPGSWRRFSMADGLYIGGVLNGTPSQYVQFSAVGIKIHSPVSVILDAPDVQINAATVEINASASTTVTTPTFTVNGSTVLNGPLSQGIGASGGSVTMLGPINVTNDVTAGGKSLKTHVHSGVQTGGGNTGAPV